MARFTGRGKALYGAYEKGVGLVNDKSACFDCVCIECVAARVADALSVGVLWLDEPYVCFVTDEAAHVIDVSGLRADEVGYVLCQLES